MKRIPLLVAVLAALALAQAPIAPHAETTPDQVHRAIETKQRIQQRVATQLGSATATEPASGHGAPASGHAAPGAAAHAAPAGHPDEGDADVWARLLAGNRRFVSGRTRTRGVVAQRAALVGGQHPDAIVLACADSRVGPELLFDQSLGDLFVVRTAGNIVDPIVLGSMEYAVEHLHAKLIVVLGHGSCGAVKAACSNDELPSQNLVALVQEIRPTVQKLTSCFEGAELVERGVRANARHSAAQILANSAILRDAVEKGHLRIVTAYYDLASGEVKPID
ncbi:MAG: carbonic anhydrase [Candidatus Eisenbacteria bacterium]|uniref:Carbonic anhydrase n=1 Tax=Eiseniibacteriota bacterium TaxID=2212470 RepID=A0A933SCK1_UNCEI|nr:carbonic anhydrase [Candidatus Eisenbacteria bacterium]